MKMSKEYRAISNHDSGCTVQIATLIQKLLKPHGSVYVRPKPVLI